MSEHSSIPLPDSRATVLGLSALAVWSVFPLLAVWAGAIPPFELSAIGFFTGFLVSVFYWRLRGESFREILGHFRLPPFVWVIGIGGFFGFHFFYFNALRMAPAAEAFLVVEIWPLIMILTSGLLPGKQLHLRHGIGALLAFAGVVIVVTRGQVPHFSKEHMMGYLAAAIAAVLWAAYSLLSARYASYITQHAIGAFCGASALLATVLHPFFEATVVPDAYGMLLLIIIGIGPMGASFFAWNTGIQRGNVTFLGQAAFGIPLVGTALLAAFGYAQGGPTLWIGAVLIVLGAVISQGKTVKKN